MAKADTAAPVQAAQDTGDVPASLPLTLNDFCLRLSESVLRPELIGAFEFHERTAGRLKATAEEFQARFDEFTNKPA